MATATQERTRSTTGSGAKTTRRQKPERGFIASTTLAENMQKVLVDLVELHVQGKQAHWNVVGKNFRDLHLQLDEIIDAAREFSDEIAERMRALHAVPDGRSDTVASTPTLPAYPNGEIDTSQTVDLITMRDVHDAVAEEDPTTADILHAIIAKLEQFAWMVSAENRTTSKS